LARSNRKTQPYYWLATEPTTKTRQRNKERQREKNRERLRTRTSGLIGSSPLKTKQNHSENAKSRNSKQELFFKNQPSSSLQKNFKRVAFCLQKDNKTDHLEHKKLLTTTKSQESVKLTIDNPNFAVIEILE